MAEAKKKSISTRFIDQLKLIWKNTTVEPVLFCVFFAQELDSVTYNQLTINKACLNDFHYSQDICDNLLDGNHTEENDVVQDEVGTS